LSDQYFGGRIWERMTVENQGNGFVAPYQITRDRQDLIRSRARLKVYTAVADGRGISAARDFYLTHADDILTSSVRPWAEGHVARIAARNEQLVGQGQADEVATVPSVEELLLQRAGEIFSMDQTAARRQQEKAAGEGKSRLMGRKNYYLRKWIDQEQETTQALEIRLAYLK
jgi:hypothetical protein